MKLWNTLLSAGEGVKLNPGSTLYNISRYLCFVSFVKVWGKVRDQWPWQNDINTQFCFSHYLQARLDTWQSVWGELINILCCVIHYLINQLTSDHSERERDQSSEGYTDYPQGETLREWCWCWWRGWGEGSTETSHTSSVCVVVTFSPG